MKAEDLVAAGHLTEDLWVLPLRTRDGDVLLPRQALRVYGHAKRASLPDGLAELCDEQFESRPVCVEPDDAYAFTAAMEMQWRTHGVFPYDTSQNPERYDSITLPTVVKEAMDRVLLPFHTQEDLVNLAKLYTGAFEEGFDALSSDARDRRLHELRKLPVIRRVCRTEGCNELVVMSLRAAIVSIEKYGLLPKPLLEEYNLDTSGQRYLPSRTFRPHALCNTCADQRQAQRGSGRATNGNGRRKGRSSASSRWKTKLGDVAQVTLPQQPEETPVEDQA